jgi:hypothetical protein
MSKNNNEKGNGMSDITGLPTLSKGAHHANSGKACLMEYVSLLAGEVWSDHPACTHPALSGAAQGVNDAIGDDGRHRLVPMIVRLFGTDEPIDNARFLLFIAQSVEKNGHLNDRLLNAATEGFLDGEWDKVILQTAYLAYGGSVSLILRPTTECARYAASQALNPTQQWSMAAGYAAAKSMRVNIFGYATKDPVAWLGSLLDEYDRLSGRNTIHKLTDDDMALLNSVSAT